MNLMNPSIIKNESRLKEAAKYRRHIGSKKYIIYPPHFAQEQTESNGKLSFFRLWMN